MAGDEPQRPPFRLVLVPHRRQVILDVLTVAAGRFPVPVARFTQTLRQLLASAAVLDPEPVRRT